MPRSQVASVANWDIGAPAVEAPVLKWRVKQGGKLTIRIENVEGVNDVEVTAQVSDDDTTYVDTAVATNGFALANLTTARKEYNEYEIFLRQGQDLFLRLLAVGGTRVQVQVRGDAILDAVDF